GAGIELPSEKAVDHRDDGLEGSEDVRFGPAERGEAERCELPLQGAEVLPSQSHVVKEIPRAAQGGVIQLPELRCELVLEPESLLPDAFELCEESLESGRLVPHGADTEAQDVPRASLPGRTESASPHAAQTKRLPSGREGPRAGCASRASRDKEATSRASR